MNGQQDPAKDKRPAHKQEFHRVRDGGGDVLKQDKSQKVDFSQCKHQYQSQPVVSQKARQTACQTQQRRVILPKNPDGQAKTQQNRHAKANDDDNPDAGITGGRRY